MLKICWTSISPTLPTKGALAIARRWGWWTPITGRWPCTTWSGESPLSSSSFPCHHFRKVQLGNLEKTSAKPRNVDQKRLVDWRRDPPLRRWWSTWGNRQSSEPKSKSEPKSEEFKLKQVQFKMETTALQKTRAFILQQYINFKVTFSLLCTYKSWKLSSGKSISKALSVACICPLPLLLWSFWKTLLWPWANPSDLGLQLY